MFLLLDAGWNQDSEVEESSTSGLRQLQLHCIRQERLQYFWQNGVIPSFQQNRYFGPFFPLICVLNIFWEEGDVKKQ